MQSSPRSALFAGFHFDDYRVNQACGLPSRGQQDAVSGDRKQTAYAFVFWRVPRHSGTILMTTTWLAMQDPLDSSSPSTDLVPLPIQTIVSVVSLFNEA